MLYKNILAVLCVVVTLAATCQVQGQIDLPGPRFRNRDVESSENTRPFADPGVFNYDAQAFAPVDFASNDELDANTGFFFTYDRFTSSISRPSGENVQVTANRPSGTNNLWGNRYQGGWMSEDDTGWLIGYQQGRGVDLVHGQDILASSPMLITTNMATVELNRVFRQETESGGYLEPYVGVRYAGFSDETLQDLVQGANVARFKQRVSNSGFGLQAGGRYTQRRGRFRYSGNATIATMYNQQRLVATDIQPTPAVIIFSESYFSGNSFVPVIDLKFDLAYNISRDIAIRGGVQVQSLWDGVARANSVIANFNPNSIFGASTDPVGFVEDGILAAGFSVGVEWRR